MLLDGQKANFMKHLGVNYWGVGLGPTSLYVIIIVNFKEDKLMNYSIFRFTLNMHNHRSQAMVKVFQGDTAVKLIITLTDGGNVYKIREGNVATLTGTKADGSKITHSCTITDNTIIYLFDEETADTAGLVTCEITLYDENGGVITAPKFTIDVDEKEVSGSDPISEYSATAIATVMGAAAKEFEREASEEARKANEDNRQESYNKAFESAREAKEFAERIAPLVLDEVLTPKTTHDHIKIGYANSIDSESLNKTPYVGERFWGVCKTTDSFVYGFVAKITGSVNEQGYYPFTFDETPVLLHSPYEQPLVIQSLMNLRDNKSDNFTYAELKQLYESKENVRTWGRNHFNRDAIVGDEFFALVRTKDDYIVAINAEVTEVDTAAATYGRPTFKITDLELVHNPKEIPLVVDETLTLIASHSDIKQGYVNSIDRQSLNKAPNIGECFWGTCTTKDSYVYSFVAEVTGGVNSSGFYPFKFIEVVLLHEPSPIGVIGIDEVERDGKYYLKLTLANGLTTEVPLDDITSGFAKKSEVYDYVLPYRLLEPGSDSPGEVGWYRIASTNSLGKSCSSIFKITAACMGGCWSDLIITVSQCFNQAPQIGILSHQHRRSGTVDVAIPKVRVNYTKNAMGTKTAHLDILLGAPIVSLAVVMLGDTAAPNDSLKYITEWTLKDIDLAPSVEVLTNASFEKSTVDTVWADITASSAELNGLKAYVDKAIANVGSGGGKLYRHVLTISSIYNEDDWENSYNYTLYGTVYRSSKTKITSVSQLDEAEMLSFRALDSSISIGDYPEATKFFGNVSNHLYNGKPSIWVNYLGSYDIDFDYTSIPGFRAVENEDFIISDNVMEV